MGAGNSLLCQSQSQLIQLLGPREPGVIKALPSLSNPVWGFMVGAAPVLAGTGLPMADVLLSHTGLVPMGLVGRWALPSWLYHVPCTMLVLLHAQCLEESHWCRGSICIWLWLPQGGFWCTEVFSRFQPLDSRDFAGIFAGYFGGFGLT